MSSNSQSLNCNKLYYLTFSSPYILSYNVLSKLKHTFYFLNKIVFALFLSRLERAKKLQEQKEKELLEKQQQQQQEIAAGKK